MDYQALYRKYRPQRFGDIIGQGHVTETLTREVTEDRVAHAYLFAGPRGTGKTTTARILAKALNCPNRGPDGEPCNTCDSCRGVTDGSSLDVIELDAASHNSVEDIRDIRVSVTTVASVGGAKRVFILDEAHMLSKAAGNALLKTLEEPPPHVHFVLATTEPYKLLDTIRSRSQRFDFHNVAVETLAGYLDRIGKSEQYEADRAALVSVARHARGSVRDGLSLLEQVAALGGGKVDVRGVNRALGLADADAYGRLATAVTDRDAKSAIELVAALAAEGVDLRRFVAEAISFFRGVFLAHYAPNLSEVVDEPSDVVEEWRRVAKSLAVGEVLRVVDQLSDALLRLREGREERLMVELTLLRLTRPETAEDLGSVRARLETLEQRVRKLGTGVTPAPQRPEPEATEARREEVPEPPVREAPAPPPVAVPQPQEPAGQAPPVEGLTFAQFESIWPALVGAVRDDLGPRRQALFREAIPGAVDGSTVVLALPEHLSFHLEQLRSDQLVKRVVETKAAELLGGAVRVEFRAGAPSTTDEPDWPGDKDELVEAPGESMAPEALVEGLLGGQVIEEVLPDD